MYRVRGKLVRETLGSAALIPNVGDARSRARISLQKAQAGVNPVEERREAKRVAEVKAERIPKSLSIGVDIFLARHAERNIKPSTYPETKRVLKHDVKSVWGDRPSPSISFLL